MVTDVSEEVAASGFRACEVKEKFRGLHILKMGAANCGNAANQLAADTVMGQNINAQMQQQPAR